MSLAVVTAGIRLVRWERGWVTFLRKNGKHLVWLCFYPAAMEGQRWRGLQGRSSGSRSPREWSPAQVDRCWSQSTLPLPVCCFSCLFAHTSFRPSISLSRCRAYGEDTQVLEGFLGAGSHCILHGGVCAFWVSCREPPPHFLPLKVDCLLSLYLQGLT